MTLYGKEHVERYKATDGEEGHIWRDDSTVLILTTTGRKSGEPRETPLIYETRGDDFVIVASQGGAPRHPAWYLNLQADPRAHVQVRGEHYDVRARTAEGKERADLWELVNRQWPAYESYQQKTEREIPVVVLERV